VNLNNTTFILLPEECIYFINVNYQIFEDMLINSKLISKKNQWFNEIINQIPQIKNIWEVNK
jgi:hypothetical protein